MAPNYVSEWWLVLGFGICASACAGKAPVAPETKLPQAELHAALVVHGGAGSDRAKWKSHTDVAAEKGLLALKQGGAALDAAILATSVLEDDPQFNAGTGANIRMDGKTVQMDAACMDGKTGAFGAVAAIERVKNPVLVAKAVMATPHLLIVGEGATRFARTLGFPDYDPICKESRERFERVKRLLLGNQTTPGAMQAWTRFDWKKHWNFPTPLTEVVRKLQGSSDTVGAVARDEHGQFAAAISTGGTTITFFGRVGDVPIYGAGIYAGPRGAVACTGNGEDIVRHLLAKAVYDDLARDVPPQDAVDRHLARFPQAVDIGLIAISAQGEGGGSNLGGAPQFRDNMAWSVAK